MDVLEPDNRELESVRCAVDSRRCYNSVLAPSDASAVKRRMAPLGARMVLLSATSPLRPLGRHLQRCNLSTVQVSAGGEREDKMFKCLNGNRCALA
eukprot:2420560-Pleurochrysis_carterae.AAC.3